MKKITVAVVGLGNMGKHHARVYAQLKNIQLVAVCDANVKRANEFGNMYRVPSFIDYKQLVSSFPKLTIASVAVPTDFHEKVAVFFLKNKTHVLLEKPIAKNMHSARRIFAAARANNVKIMVGHVERFNPAVLALKQLIDKGKLGNIVSLIAKRVGIFPPAVSDTNVFLDLAIHDVDIINFLLGEHPVKIYKNKEKSHTTVQEDSGELFLLYKHAAAFVQVNWVTPVKIRSVSVTGTRGYAELDYITQELIFHKTKVKKRYDTYAEFLQLSRAKTKKIPIEHAEPLQKEIECFINAVKNDGNVPIAEEEILNSLAICLK